MAALQILLLDERPIARSNFWLALQSLGKQVHIHHMGSLAEASRFLIAQPVHAVFVPEKVGGIDCDAIIHRLRTLRADVPIFVQQQNMPLATLRSPEPVVEKREVAELSSLSVRERQVFERIARGNSGSEIAAELQLSVKSIDTYRRRLMQKLQARDVTDIVRAAIRFGIMSA